MIEPERDSSGKFINYMEMASPIAKGRSNEESITFVTPDLSDKTTWYQNSTQVTDETLTDSGDGLTFNSANTDWIWMEGSGDDDSNPKAVFDKKGIVSKTGDLVPASTYKVVVKVNDVEQTSGYSVNYPNGTVTFTSSQSGKTVKASYYHVSGGSNRSSWFLSPPDSHSLKMEHIELQFSKNISFSSGRKICFDTWAGGLYTDYEGISWNRDYPYCVDWTDYNSFHQFVGWCNNMYPRIPAAAGLSNDLLVFPFKYLIAPEIFHLTSTDYKQMCIRLSLKNDSVLSECELATATFYCVMTHIGE